MLEHPWLSMEDNYDFKYTEREFEVMMLKRDLKNKVRSGTNAQDDAGQEERQEMNELIDSDPELYAADSENEIQTPSRRMAAKSDSSGFDSDEISLEDPSEAREKLEARKEEESKIHNSFTGPYPLDPTEFNHTDKGENAQFTTLL